MSYTNLKDLFTKTDNFIDSTVTVEGWVKTVRDSKSFGFLEINDGTFFKNVQIVFDDTLSNFSEICKLPLSSSIKVTGDFIKTEGAKQPFEIKATNIEIEFLVEGQTFNYKIEVK